MKTVYFTTHNSEGVILRVVSCPADHVALQRLRPGEFMLEGKADCVTQKVVDGQVVDKTLAELNTLKTKKKFRICFENVKKPPKTSTPL